MTAKAKAQVPVGLEDKSRAFFVAVVGLYELRVDELVLLESACREIDLVEKLTAEVAAAPDLTIPGRYAGTMIAHPLLAELSAHRRLIVTLLKTMGLPDDVLVGAMTTRTQGRSTRARAAAQARWAKPS